MNKSAPRFSVIVPVLNEREGIRQFLRHVRDVSGDEEIEIIVVDADQAGGTIKEIHPGEATGLLSPRGRGVQMNLGAAAARGRILLFLHADTFLPRHAFESIKNALSGERYVGGAFDLGIDSGRFLMRLTAVCASLKHRVTRVPYGDQAIFLRADYFRETGGYRDIPLFEDVELMKRIKRSGKKIVIIGQRTKTSPRKWEKEGAVFTIFRNWTLQILYLLGASPEFLVKYYYGNKDND